MPRRKKIKNMSTEELREYRRKKQQERKEKQEKEAAKKSRAAKKAAATRKKNQKAQEREAKKRSAAAKKAAITKKRKEREIKKAEQEKKRKEREANRIVVPKKKPLKDMTPEELKEYRREYSRRYAERKRKEKEEKYGEQVGKHLRGQAKKRWQQRHRRAPAVSFSEINEDKDYLIKPLTGHSNATFTCEGLGIHGEIFVKVLLSSKKPRTCTANMGFFIFTGLGTGPIYSYDVRVIDVTDMIDELTDRNFAEKIQPLTEKAVDEMMKWDTSKFIEQCVEHSRNKNHAAESLYSVMDKKYAEKTGWTINKFASLARSRSIRKRKQKKRKP